MVGLIGKALSIFCISMCLVLYKPPPPEIEETKEIGESDSKQQDNLTDAATKARKDESISNEDDMKFGYGNQGFEDECTSL